MPNESPYHVFLGHSAKDKAVVRPLAERLGVQMFEVISLDQVASVLGEVTRIAESKGQSSGE